MSLLITGLGKMSLRIKLLLVVLGNLFWDIVEAFYFFTLLTFALIFFSNRRVLEIKEELLKYENMGKDE